MSRFSFAILVVLVFAALSVAQQTPDKSVEVVDTVPQVVPELPSVPPVDLPGPVDAEEMILEPPQNDFNELGLGAAEQVPSPPPEIVRPLPPTRRYESRERPWDAIQRIAAEKAALRRQRIAMQKAMGYSPQRPPARMVPFMSGPSPYSIIRPPFYYPTVTAGRPIVTPAR